jgi:hypothetical protein
MSWLYFQPERSQVVIIQRTFAIAVLDDPILRADLIDLLDQDLTRTVRDHQLGVPSRYHMDLLQGRESLWGLDVGPSLHGDSVQVGVRWRQVPLAQQTVSVKAPTGTVPAWGVEQLEAYVQTRMFQVLTPMLPGFPQRLQVIHQDYESGG